MDNLSDYESPPTANDIISIVRIFTILFVTLIIINYLSWDTSNYYIWFTFCIPLILYLIILSISNLLDKLTKIHPLIPEHVEMFIFQVITILLVHITGGVQSGFKILYLLPVVLYSLRYGAKTGYISSLINTYAVLNFYFISTEKFDFLHMDLAIILSFFLFSWLIGDMVAAERSIRKQLLEQANRDELTGLYNYRFFQHQLAETIANFHTLGEEKIGLIILDLDNFNLYNEIFGFLSGDNVLKRVSATIRRFLEERDFAARYGGDTFVILTITRETSQVVAKAEKIRKTIDALQNVILGHNRSVSASLGVAIFPDQADDPESLIQKANEALYKVKITRGNRVQLYYSIFDRISGEKLKTEKDFLDTVKTLMAVIHAKDKFTYGHSERVLVYAQLICRALKLPAREVSRIEYAALLHDIGKIEISKDILNEPCPLPREKWEIFKQHPVWSAEIIKPLKKLEPLLPIIIHHHERVDGKGYPHGLKGDEIPLGARILSVVNTFDLLTTGRIKGNGKSINESLDFLVKKTGSMFDPVIVNCFVSCLNEYKSISGMLEWPRDLCKLVPAGYIPGFLVLGGHYGEFYSGNVHLAVKAVSYCAAGVMNNEKVLYHLNTETEKLFLEKLSEHVYRGLPTSSLIKKNQVARWENIEQLLHYLERRAMLEFETKKILKTNLDETYADNFTSLRVILDTSSLSLTPNQMLTWENNLSSCIKDLDLLFICFYDFAQESLELCRMLYNLHDRPLYTKEDEESKKKAPDQLS